MTERVTEHVPSEPDKHMLRYTGSPKPWVGHAWSPPLDVVPPCASADPAVWFPDKGDNSQTAKTICGRCPLQDECLQAAINQNELYGIWGGTNPHNRKQLGLLQTERSKHND